MITKLPQQRNKELTKRKLINAIGEVLEASGYPGLGINRIAKQAGVDKKLIYRYFGNLNNLIEAYVAENDFWLVFAQNLANLDVPNDLSGLKLFIATLLKELFTHFQRNYKLQHLILWELSAKSDVMNSIHRTREMTGERFFDMLSPYFEGTGVSYRAIAALLVGGIYYTILHTRHNGNMFNGVNISSLSGTEEMFMAIDQILENTFVDTKQPRV